MTLADLQSADLGESVSRIERLEAHLDRILERMALAAVATDESGSLLEDPFGFSDMILTRNERVMLKLRAIYDHRAAIGSFLQLRSSISKLIG